MNQEQSLPGTDPRTLTKEIGMPLFNSKGWMKLIGVLAIIQGALVALSIVGILIAWLPIWMGALLLQSANNAERAIQTGDSATLNLSLRKLQTYFTITGVLTLISLIVVAFTTITMLLTGGSFLQMLRSM